MSSRPVRGSKSRAGSHWPAIFATVLGLISAGDNVLGWDLSLIVQQWEDGLGKSLYRAGDVLGTTSLAAIVTGIALIIARVKTGADFNLPRLVLVFRLLGTQLKPFQYVLQRNTFVSTRRLSTGYRVTTAPVAMVAAMLVLIMRYLQNTRATWAITAFSVGCGSCGGVAFGPVLTGRAMCSGWSFGFAMVRHGC